MTIDTGIVLVLTYLLVSAIVVFAFLFVVFALALFIGLARTPPRTARRRVAAGRQLITHRARRLRGPCAFVGIAWSANAPPSNVMNWRSRCSAAAWRSQPECFRRSSNQLLLVDFVQQLCSYCNTLTISKGSPTAERIA